MRRGDIVIAAVGGDYGKPRPAVVIQTDALPPSHTSVVICQMTSTVVEPSSLRITLLPTAANGLRTRCQIMADRPVTIRRAKIGQVIGRLTGEQMAALNRTLAFTLGLAD